MRLGCGKNDAFDIKMHPFFKGVEWENVLSKKIKCPEIFMNKMELNMYNSELFIENLIQNEDFEE